RSRPFPLHETLPILKAKGFDPGEVDGVLGRQTIAAVKAFQKANGLADDGVVGPQTTGALMGAAAPTTPAEATPLVWFEEARHLRSEEHTSELQSRAE